MRTMLYEGAASAGFYIGPHALGVPAARGAASGVERWQSGWTTVVWGDLALDFPAAVLASQGALAMVSVSLGTCLACMALRNKA
jgi:hypothetical protein